MMSLFLAALTLVAQPAAPASPATPNPRPGAPAVPSADSDRLVRMVALYDELCLKTFPDDAAVDAMMAAKGARVLTPEEAKVTLRDDPGRGWLLTDGDRQVQVMIEMPPYHACSVRWMTAAGLADIGGYRTISTAYKASHPGFTAPQPLNTTQGGYEIRGVTEMRPLPAGAADALMIVEQRIADPARRAAGENGVSVRFVHQMFAPPQH